MMKKNLIKITVKKSIVRVRILAHKDPHQRKETSSAFFIACSLLMSPAAKIGKMACWSFLGFIEGIKIHSKFT